MTAFELIQQLKTLPADTRIVIRGYEDGYNDISKLREVRIAKPVELHWYIGEYIDCDEDDGAYAMELFGENKSAKD